MGRLIFIWFLAVTTSLMPEWNENREIILPHHQNFISMEFAALNYVNAHNNKYAYYLENFDQDWVYSHDRRFVSYTNLSPGEYVFRVKSSNYDGVWSEEGINLSLIILPPWWRTWWAYLLFLLLAMLSFYWMRKSIIYWERLNSDLKLKQVEAEKMQELDHAKSAFFANISHEFRTPLTLISGSVDSLKKKERKPGYRSEAYELIERNASKLLHLIHQLLDLSKLEAGKLKVEEAPGELSGFLGYLIGSFFSLFESKEIYFHHELPEEEVYVYFDAPKFEVIFSNLLSNAYKFTPEGGEVGFYASLEAEKDNSLKLTVVVSDTGVGIPEGKSSHVFERFYQEESSTTRAYEGTGIGLSLVKELTGLMGGEVSVKSKLGKGTSFKVELPLRIVSPNEIVQIKLGERENGFPQRKFQPQDEYKTHYPSKNLVSDKPKILVVEDNVDLRRFIDSHLKEGYCVSEAENGLVGFEIAMDIIPDLIISDVMMPGMDGICLCEKLKNEDKTNHIPIILLTARADMESRIDGLEMGADDYLTKPFKIEELLARVKNLLDTRKKLREKYGNSLNLNPREISVTSVEEKFVQKLFDTLEKHHANPEFDVEALGRELGMSRTHLYRKLKAIINQHPTEFIQTFRLKKAVMHFDNHSGNISEVAYGLGFNSLTYFTRLFKKYYGMTPSDYIQKFSENNNQYKHQHHEKRND